MTSNDKPVTYTTERLPNGWLRAVTSDGRVIIVSTGGNGK